MMLKASFVTIIHLFVGCCLALDIPLWRDMTETEKMAVAEDAYPMLINKIVSPDPENEVTVDEMKENVDICYNPITGKFDTGKMLIDRLSENKRSSLQNSLHMMEFLLSQEQPHMATNKDWSSKEKKEYIMKYNKARIYSKAYHRMVIMAGSQGDFEEYKKLYVKEKDYESEYLQMEVQESEDSKKEWANRLNECKRKMLDEESKTTMSAAKIKDYINICRAYNPGEFDVNRLGSLPKIQQWFASIIGIQQEPGTHDENQQPEYHTLRGRNRKGIVPAGRVITGLYPVFHITETNPLPTKLYEVSAIRAAQVVIEKEQEFGTAYLKAKYGKDYRKVTFKTRLEEENALREYKEKRRILRLFKINDENDLQTLKEYFDTLPDKSRTRFRIGWGKGKKVEEGSSRTSRGKGKEVQKDRYVSAAKTGKKENDLKIKEFGAMLAADRVVVAENIFRYFYRILESKRNPVVASTSLDQARHQSHTSNASSSSSGTPL